MFSRKGHLGRTAHAIYQQYELGEIPSEWISYLEPHNTLQLKPKLTSELYLKFPHFYKLTLLL